MRGAEAVLQKKRLLGREVVVKTRLAKRYRIAALDRKLRAERTRSEARLLNRAKAAGTRCPTVLEVEEFGITMSYVPGGRPVMDAADAMEAGSALAKLHQGGIIHGDYTPANLIRSPEGLFIIDFGLGFVSDDIEDKAVDVFTMLRFLADKRIKDAFVSGYSDYARSRSVLERVKDVEKRVRYAY